MNFRAYKIAEGKWGVVLVLSVRQTIDQHLTFKTRRAAVSAASAFQRELDELNRG